MPVSLKDVAREAGVSVPTVSLIMNGSSMPFKQETRARVLAAAESLGYRPDSIARRTGSASQRRDAIGMLVRSESSSHLANTPAYEFICGINDVLMEQNQFLTLVKLKQLEEARAGAQPRMIAERFVDGLIVETGLPGDLEQAVMHYRIPTIWLNTGHHDAFDCVYPDEIHSAMTATQRLIQSGHRRILFIAPPTQLLPVGWHYSAIDRQKGYTQALAAHGLAAQIINEGDLHQTQIRDAINLILHSRQTSDAITGVVTHGFSVAVKLRYELHAAGVMCPQEISVISPDDLHLLRRTWPDITGITCDRYEMGRCAAEMMLAKITSGNPQPSRVFRGTLMERATVSTIGPGKRTLKRSVI